jgi:protein-S-isoprenylcysteine O-methyltransferase Ste14
VCAGQGQSRIANARGAVAKRDTKGFDRAWLAIYPIFTFGNLIVMGFDAVRFQWTSMPLWPAFPAIAVFIIAMTIATWSMAVNNILSGRPASRRNRGQQICTDFPYSFVRHPGYLALILSQLCYPLVLGSWRGFLASGILGLVIIVRTALEDSMLQQELPGYKAYTHQVKYRLLPFVW